MHIKRRVFENTCSKYDTHSRFSGQHDVIGVTLRESDLVMVYEMCQVWLLSLRSYINFTKVEVILLL